MCKPWALASQPSTSIIHRQIPANSACFLKDTPEIRTPFLSPNAVLTTVEPTRTHVKEFYTPCSLCNDVVQEGSRRFDALGKVCSEITKRQDPDLSYFYHTSGSTKGSGRGLTCQQHVGLGEIPVTSAPVVLSFYQA